MGIDFASAYQKALKGKKLVLMPSPEVPEDAPEHARLGPSAAEGWMTCAGRPQMESHFEDTTSIFAAEGTVAHWIREQCLLNDKPVSDYIGDDFEQDGFIINVEPEWERFLQPSIDWDNQHIGLIFVEYRVDLSAWIPDEFGTLDTAIITKDEIILKDLKFGRGIRVEAFGNKQMRLYAAGLWENLIRHIPGAPTKYRLIIDQPRVIGGQSFNNEWVVELEDILKFAEEASLAAEKTNDPDAPLVPSLKGCAFCRAAENVACSAYAEFALDLVGLKITDLDKPFSEAPEMPQPQKLSPERRSYILEHSKMLSKFITNLHGDALTDAQSGKPTPGFKAVATLGDRSWTDEMKAESFWRSKMADKDIFNKKLKSPAQMEKIAGTRNWKKAQELIHRPEGKPALVPENDPRPALEPLADLLDDYDELDDLLGVETVSTADDIEDLI